MSYRARLLIAIRTEITDNLNITPSQVDVEPTYPITEVERADLILCKTRRSKVIAFCQYESWRIKEMRIWFMYCKEDNIF